MKATEFLGEGHLSNLSLETVTQSEVSQKEKNKYRMLTHIYGIQKIKKKDSEEPRGRTEIKDVDVENGLEDTGRGTGKLGRTERVAWTYTLPNVK